jgi:hypothetical protein
VKGKAGFGGHMSKLLNKFKVLFGIVRDFVRWTYTNDYIERECSLETPCPLCRLETEFWRGKEDV